MGDAPKYEDAKPSQRGAKLYGESTCIAFNRSSLLDALDRIQSNRLDGLEQTIQSLLVFYNCELPEDDNGNSITTRQIRESGALFLKSFGENKADLKELVTNLDQAQTQVLVDYIYQQIQRICALPLVSHGTTYDTTGAAVLASAGWYQADASARSTEDLFKRSNRRFDKLFTKILRAKGLLDIKPSEFELNFVRNETSAAQSKAQTLQTLLAAGMAPELAFAKSGISNDPVADVAQSKPWIDMVWGNPTEAKAAGEAKGEATIIEEDRAVGDDTSV
jgi:SPP1 family phage portal protein